MSRAVRGQGAALMLEGTADAARGDAADAVTRVRRERVRATALPRSQSVAVRTAWWLAVLEMGEGE